MNQENVVLDHVAGIIIDPNNPPVHNLHALDFLPHGLWTLARTMRDEENRVIQWNLERYGIDAKALSKSISMMGIVGANNSLCICLFHWFSVSLVNYLRLVGLVGYYQANGIRQVDIVSKSDRLRVRKYCDEYCVGIIPKIVRWRNKIGAHMAITSPFEDDSQGTLEMSAQNSISHENLRIYTNGAIWVANNETAVLPKWSITEEYEELRDRFWPQYSLQILNV